MLRGLKVRFFGLDDSLLMVSRNMAHNEKIGLVYGDGLSIGYKTSLQGNNKGLHPFR